MRHTLAGLGSLLLVAAPVPAAVAQDTADSSLLSWIDAFGDAAEARLADAGDGAVHLIIGAGRGVDERKARQVAGPHLVERLRAGGRTVSRDRGALTLTVTFSLEGDSVWAVGLLEGGELAAPVAVARAWPVDRELETVLGARSVRAGQGRWTMDRLGTLPAGVLDLQLMDLDGDGGEDLVVLSVDGVRSFAWSGLAGRPVPLGGPFPLGEPGSWPRLPLGWLAVDGGELLVATSAGQRVRLDPSSGETRPSDGPIAISQPVDASRDPFVSVRWPGPGPGLQLLLPVPGAPTTVRDIARWPGRDDAWLWVDDAGLLGGLGVDGPATFGATRVGDRILLDDLDGDGGPELVTTSASAPGAPDRVRIHRVQPDLAALPVVFDGPVGGSIVAAAAGDLDFDGRRELLLIEQTDGDAVLWLVARRQ